MLEEGEDLEFVVLNLRFTLDKLNRKESSIFQFNGGRWRLNDHDAFGVPYCLALQMVSGECRCPFSVTVSVEGVRTPDLTQKTNFTQDFPILTVGRIWAKRVEEIARVVPGFLRKRKNILKLLINLRVEDGLSPTGSVSCQTECDIPEDFEVSCLDNLVTDFGGLIAQESTPPDMMFKCAGQSIRAHAAIVRARSAAISAMLGSNMSEGCRVVEIPDVEPDIFKHFLNYIYSAQLPKLTVDLALRLYQVGKKYAVHELAKRCSRYLEQYLTPQGACDVLVVANALGVEDFVEKISNYLVNVRVPVDRWYIFSKHHPELAAQVYNTGLLKLIRNMN